MTSCTPSNLHEYAALRTEASIDCSHHYKLTWRQGKLLVSFSRQMRQPALPSLASKARLSDCLAHSPAQQIGLDPSLGEAGLKFWAEASLQADKTVFLRLPSNPALPHKHHPLGWWLKGCVERVMAALLLLVLSPLMLGLGLLLTIDSTDPVLTRDWRVGERGKLFQVFQFRTDLASSCRSPQASSAQALVRFAHLLGGDRLAYLKQWMRQYKLDKLPQLVNVLQGDMSLVGPRALNLREAAQLDPADRQQLNALPGLTGTWRAARQLIKPASRSGLPQLTLKSASQPYQ